MSNIKTTQVSQISLESVIGTVGAITAIGTGIASVVSNTKKVAEDVAPHVKNAKAVIGSMNSSLTDVSKIAQVRPVTLYSEELKVLDEFWDISHGVLNIYTAYYLQAVNVLATQLVDTRILSILDSLNPNRTMKSFFSTVAIESGNATPVSIIKRQTPSEAALNVSRYIALEGLEHGRTLVQAIALKNKRDFEHDRLGVTVAMENNAEKTVKVKSGDDAKASQPSVKRIEGFDKSDQVVGKIIEVSMKVKGEDNVVTVPVVVKLDTIAVPGDVLSQVMTLNEESVSFTSRFKDAMAGRIGFFKDFIMAEDLIRNQKSAMMRDKSGAFSKVLERANSSRAASLSTRNMSLNTISAIMIVTQNDMDRVRREYGGDLSTPYTRKMIFDNSSVMMIVVIDTVWKNVSIYVKNADYVSEVPFKHFKKPGGGQDSDVIMELFKSMNSGRAPSF